MNPLTMIFVGCGMLLLPVLTVGSVDSTSTTSHEALANRYVGQKVCKNCHAGDDKGSTHEKWADGAHAKAFETLGSAKAKEIAAKMDIEDPQKSEKCLKCHVTAFGVDEKLIKRGFKHEDGIQCESCHGPGEDHFKARFKASQQDKPDPVGEGEVTVGRDPQTCLQCHNENSPTYKEFCFKERMAAIEHLDPRKERSEEELKKLRATCTPDCEKCKKDGDK